MEQIYKKKKLGFILSAAAIAIIVALSCKDEDNGDDPVPTVENAARCQLEIPGGQTEYDYGDTIALNGRLTQTSRFYDEMVLYLNNARIYKTSKTSFSYNIYTVGLAAGDNTIKLTASDHRDSLYADTAQVTLNALLPTVETLEVMGIGTDTATIYGRYVSSGGLHTEWGLCYNTTGTPTKEENTFTTTDSTFSLKLTGLGKTTIYYVRAWATNAVGTSYGETKGFKTTDKIGYFTDFRDDHVYKWVKIGNQIWMAENMAWEGDTTIIEVNNSEEWSNTTTGFSYYLGNKQKYSHYGIYYQFHAAQNVCPDGWHLPTPTEWETLGQSLGGLDIAGKHLKTRTGWEENGNGTNYSGFSGIPAGFRYNDGSWWWDELFDGKYGTWWIDETEEYFATNAVLYSKSDILKIYGGILINQGRNVRCIKDE